MERFVKDDVVIIPFPFSDLSTTKRRPALVVAAPGGDDVILCQITSREAPGSLRYQYHRYGEGSLHKQSNVRPNRLFSASTSLILYRAVTSVITRIIDILQAG